MLEPERDSGRGLDDLRGALAGEPVLESFGSEQPAHVLVARRGELELARPAYECPPRVGGGRTSVREPAQLVAKAVVDPGRCGGHPSSVPCESPTLVESSRQSPCDTVSLGLGSSDDRAPRCPCARHGEQEQAPLGRSPVRPVAGEARSQVGPVSGGTRRYVPGERRATSSTSRRKSRSLYGRTLTRSLADLASWCASLPRACVGGGEPEPWETCNEVGPICLSGAGSSCYKLADMLPPG
jgi:hypothetical protein